jgi:hypothetical protein
MRDQKGTTVVSILVRLFVNSYESGEGGWGSHQLSGWRHAGGVGAVADGLPLVDGQA